MAKLTFPSYIKEGHGRMEDAVLSSWKGIPYMKAYKKPSSTSLTENQKEIRASFRSLAEDWKSLSGIIRESWNVSVKGISRTGYNAFIGENLARRRAGEPIELSFSMGEDMLTGLTAETGTATGEIICSFIPPESGRHVSFFVRRETDSKGESFITRHDAGPDPASPLTIEGLDAGSEYSVYAVVTDAAYDEAASISRSAPAMAVSGE